MCALYSSIFVGQCLAELRLSGLLQGHVLSPARDMHLIYAGSKMISIFEDAAAAWYARALLMTETVSSLGWPTRQTPLASSSPKPRISLCYIYYMLVSRLYCRLHETKTGNLHESIRMPHILSLDSNRSTRVVIFLHVCLAYLAESSKFRLKGKKK